jgi:hypothetical protein
MDPRVAQPGNKPGSQHLREVKLILEFVQVEVIGVTIHVTQSPQVDVKTRRFRRTHTPSGVVLVTETRRHTSFSRHQNNLINVWHWHWWQRSFTSKTVLFLFLLQYSSYMKDRDSRLSTTSRPGGLAQAVDVRQGYTSSATFAVDVIAVRFSCQLC